MSIEALDRQLDRVIRDPGNPQILNAIGAMLYQLEDWENSLQYLQKAYSLDSLNIDFIYNYSRILYKRHKYQEAIDILKPCLEKVQDIEIIKGAADCYYLMGDYKAADRLYQELQGL